MGIKETVQEIMKDAPCRDCGGKKRWTRGLCPGCGGTGKDRDRIRREEIEKATKTRDSR